MKKLLIIALTIIIATSIIGCSGQDHSWTIEEYYVEPGDTLWGIARQYCPDDMDIREYIYEVEEYNNMPTSGLRAGQTIDVLVDKGEA